MWECVRQRSDHPPKASQHALVDATTPTDSDTLVVRGAVPAVGACGSLTPTFCSTPSPRTQKSSRRRRALAAMPTKQQRRTPSRASPDRPLRRRGRRRTRRAGQDAPLQVAFARHGRRSASRTAYHNLPGSGKAIGREPRGLLGCARLDRSRRVRRNELNSKVYFS